MPTGRGLLMAALIGLSLAYSYELGSEADRWCALLMTMITLIHLTESSAPIRKLSVKAKERPVGFCGETFFIETDFANESEQASQPLIVYLKGNETQKNITVPAKSAKSFGVTCEFGRAGRYKIPRLNIKTYSPSKLFVFWRTDDDLGTVFILPRAVDHKIAPRPSHDQGNDFELKELVEIRDPRLLPFADHKMMLKTGRSFLRVYESEQKDLIHFDWLLLTDLGEQEKAEQFSFWLKQLEDYLKHSFAFVSTPFWRNVVTAETLIDLKLNFAGWLLSDAA